MRYLAIDLGNKRTGLAVGDDVTCICSSLDVIETSSESERWRRLNQIVVDEAPDALVVGWPVNMDGSVGPAAKSAEQFARTAEERFDLPVHLQDERLTSFAADEAMSRSGLTHAQKKARRDALAAAALLRAFFQSKGIT
jgi:putative Holliday junction resolvase